LITPIAVLDDLALLERLQRREQLLFLHA